MWYGYGYGFGWWWWLAFLLIFFFLPLGYGWGYRGWGPWYRRTRISNASTGGDANAGPVSETGWGWLGTFLWVILIVAAVWVITAWAWGY